MARCEGQKNFAMHETTVPMTMQRSAHSCSGCSLNSLCLPAGIHRADLQRLDNIVEVSKPLHDGDTFFEEKQEFEAVCAVKSGMFKTVALDAEGHERVVGFHLPGELIGLDAVYPEQHMTTAISIGTSTVCAIQYRRLISLATQLPGLQHQLLCLFSKEINTSHCMAAEQAAEHKLAAFLLSLSLRYKQRGYSGTRFNLAMPRRDIASYLGMAAETVSRVFKRFQEHGIVRIQRRDIAIEDMQRLETLASRTGLVG